MQRRLITVMLFALVAALISSTILYKVISANSSRPARPSGTQVLVATHDLEAGSLITPADFHAVSWQAPVAQQWVTNSEDIVGRGVLAAINQGEPFPANRLAAKGSGAGLTSRIPPGMRAVAVHVDELSGLTRLLISGMHVDVISTGSAPGAQGIAARTILQNVEVISTGQDIDHSAKDRPAAAQTVNLLVTPQQAEALSQASAQNRIQLVLRNPLDKAVALLGWSNDSSAENKPARITPAIAPLRLPGRPPASAAPLALPTIEIIHGTKKEMAVVSPATGDQTAQDTKQ